MFDYLPDTYFYAKNTHGQFVMVNQALAQMLGLQRPEEISQNGSRLLARELADQYVSEISVSSMAANHWQIRPG